jgi:two-component system OmpR family response regulator
MNADLGSDRLTRLLTDRTVRADGALLRVLVVDDNRNAAEALGAFLTYQDMSCRLAFGGVQAIETGIAWAPHVIIMDISMPECTGVEAAIVLRRDPRTCEIAMVAFTAFDESELARHIQGGEFDAYCQKGQAPSKLSALIAKMLVA